MERRGWAVYKTWSEVVEDRGGKPFCPICKEDANGDNPCKVSIVGGGKLYVWCSGEPGVLRLTNPDYQVQGVYINPEIEAL